MNRYARTTRPLWIAALAIGVAGGAAAQATAPVATDSAPPPAEDRSSSGAVVLENSLVRAQKSNAFQKSASQSGVTSLGRGVLRATRKAQLEAELAQARESDQPLHARERAGP